MTRREYRAQAQAILEPIYGAREAESIALLIAGLQRADFVMEPQASVDERLMDSMREVAMGRPVQYVLGRTEFCGLSLQVDERVLIPRPETEELVAWIARSEAHNALSILDIGTGSGAIAIALKQALPHTRVTALDVSRSALEVAKDNSLSNNVLIDFIEADILTRWPAGNFDLIVSNPPYIPSGEKRQMAAHVVDYEPHKALFVPDDDPLLFYRAIAAHAQNRLYLEVHENYAQDVVELLEKQGFTEIELREDLHGKPRMIRCRKA